MICLRYSRLPNDHHVEGQGLLGGIAALSGMRATERILVRTTNILSAGALAIAALLGQSIKTGPEAGQQVPAFSAADQDGRTVTLQSIMGPKGAMLVFFRSADW